MQVLICTYGAEGIARVADASHPHVPGVSWLVSWQSPEDTPLPDALMRDDFTIVRSNTRGLSINRNIALQNATEDIVLISDDDVRYTPAQLNRIAQLFDENPQLDIVTFRYEPTDPRYQKIYPAEERFDLLRPAKGYYLTSFEMALRLQAQRDADVWFDERFGLGSPLFPSGEEGVFLHRLTHKGLKGCHFAEILCTHAGGPTTSERMEADPRLVEANAAVKAIMHPLTWLPRQILWSFRQDKIPKIMYITASVRGVLKLMKSSRASVNRSRQQ